jgi:hypothetical protein
MRYVTRKPHRMQKHKFGITSPELLFVKSVSVPPSMKNSTSTIRSPNPTGLHYVTRRSHWMQKQMFSVTLMFHASDARECTT